MLKNKQKFLSEVTKIKHFLLGAGLVLTLVASTSFAQTVLPTGEVMPPCAAGQAPAPGNPCAPNGATPSFTPQTTAPQQSPAAGQPSQPQQPSGGGKQPFSAQAIEGAIAGGQLTADTQIPCPPLGGLAKAADCLNAAKGQVPAANQPQANIQKPAAEKTAPAVDQKVDKSKLSSAKNSTAVLAKTGLKNVEKLLNTLSKKFKKEKSKTKKIAVVRSVAKDFMKLCTKYAPSIQDEEFSDEESFTCDEFVADLSEPIGAALKSKDADLAFELTYDALDINFRELFDSLTQQ